jgi:aryl-alcohol dehydrogenase-like predicted oxidoreductase
MRGFDDLVSSGKITYIAVSNTPAWQISRANMLADLRGWAPFIGLQTEYSLVERTAERELLPMARELDLGITAWSPLAGGILSGKYDDRTETTVGRKQLISPRQREISKLVVEIAREIGRSPSQVALAAIRQQRKFGTIIPILGARNHKQFVDNMGCLDLTLEENQLRRLDQATAVPLGSPHEFLSSPHILHNAYGGHYDLLDNHRA